MECVVMFQNVIVYQFYFFHPLIYLYIRYAELPRCTLYTRGSEGKFDLFKR